MICDPPGNPTVVRRIDTRSKNAISWHFYPAGEDRRTTACIRRLGSLEKVANGVAFLMSEEASYISGFNPEVTGGEQRRIIRSFCF
jgi:NAD(P)-dependent dehydrogenase (short-subunit alcohol dehydrogenase family)